MKKWNPYKKQAVLSDIDVIDFSPKKETEEEVRLPIIITDDTLEDLSIIKALHEDNQGRKFTDGEFRQIIETLVRENAGALQSLINLDRNVLGVLIALDDATRF